MIALHTKPVSGLHVWKLGDYCTVYMGGGGGVLGTQSTTMSVGGKGLVNEPTALLP